MSRPPQRSPAAWLCIAALILLAVIAFDYATGQLSVSIFYVIPIFVAAWYGGWVPGLVMGFASSVSMVLMEDFLETSAGKPLVLWDDFMKAGFLILVAALFARLSQSLDRETALRDDLERRVRQRTVQLELSANELRAFNYALAHHLRSPLRSIARQAGLLRRELDGELNPARDERFARLDSATRRLDAVIQGMIEISSLTISDPKREDVDLTALAEAVTRELRAASPGRAVRTAIAPGLRARCEPKLAKILLGVLLGNAWKFTQGRADAAVEVSARAENGRTVFVVSDNGAGFDMAYYAKMFKPFERLHDPDEYPGLGIGLTLARQVVARHGGSLWAEGRVGRGATFYFTLEPRASARSTAA